MLFFYQILGDAVTRKQDAEPGFIVASTSDGRELSLRVFTDNISEFPRDRFRVSLVKTPHLGERQVSSLRFTGADTDTCGYVFPISSLRTGNYLPEGRWPAVYAAAATRELVETEIAVPFARQLDMSANEHEITDFFPENLGVLVLGRSQLEKASTSIEAVELMLIEYGYVPCLASFVSSPAPSAPPFSSRISLRRLSPPLTDDVDALKWLMAYTSVQQTAVGRFLTLYQIIECAISRVFGKAMGHIIADARSQSNPWWVRDMVYKIQKESWRLNFIGSNCRSGAHGAFSDNRDACLQLLIKLGELADDDTLLPWASALYRIRNIFIHRQASLREVDDNLVERICDTLLSVCFEIMGGYTEPSPDYLAKEN